MTPVTYQLLQIAAIGLPILGLVLIGLAGWLARPVPFDPVVFHVITTTADATRPGDKQRIARDWMTYARSHQLQLFLLADGWMTRALP